MACFGLVGRSQFGGGLPMHNVTRLQNVVAIIVQPLTERLFTWLTAVRDRGATHIVGQATVAYSLLEGASVV